MKLNKFLIVGMSALILSACGGGTGNGAGTLPSGGQAATKEEAIEAIGNAYETFLDLDSFEANLNLSRVHLDMTSPFYLESEAALDEVAGYGTIEVDVSGKIKAAAKGLASSDLADLEAEVKVENLNFSLYSGTEIADEVTDDIDVGFEDLDLAAYLKDGGAYLNIADKEVRDVVQLIAGLESMESFPKKIAMLDLIPSEALPINALLFGLLSEEMDLPSPEDFVALLPTIIDDNVMDMLDDYISLVSYEDGRFGVALDWNKAKLLEVLGDALASMEGSSEMLIEIEKCITLNAFKFSLLLDSEGRLSSIKIDVNGGFDSSKSDVLEGEMGSKGNVIVQTDLSFKYGDDVTVNYPTDLDSYLPLS